MKHWRWMVIGLALLVFTAGCGEEKKKAEERGKVPSEMIKNAENAIKDAGSKLGDALEDAGEEVNDALEDAKE